jgi:hypothetical protein
MQGAVDVELFGVQLKQKHTKQINKIFHEYYFDLPDMFFEEILKCSIFFPENLFMQLEI